MLLLAPGLPPAVRWSPDDDLRTRQQQVLVSDLALGEGWTSTDTGDLTMTMMTKSRSRAALLATALLATTGLSVAPAHAAVREVSGYLSCPADQYIALRTTVNTSQTIEIYMSGRLQRTADVGLVYLYNSRTPQAAWRVTGKDIEPVSDYWYKPTSGPALF